MVQGPTAVLTLKAALVSNIHISNRRTNSAVV